MSKPSWFIIIEQWREKGMGGYGLTLPFLVGALAYEKEQNKASFRDIHAILTEMIENPVDGYMTVIRWCGDINEPVISVKALDDPYKMAIKDSFPRPYEDGMSVAFTEDLMSMFNLNCEAAEECREKLANYAKEYVEKGTFSKVFNPETMQREFGDFSEDDINYIKAVIPNLT